MSPNIFNFKRVKKITYCWTTSDRSSGRHHGHSSTGCPGMPEPHLGPSSISSQCTQECHQTLYLLEWHGLQPISTDQRQNMDQSESRLAAPVKAPHFCPSSHFIGPIKNKLITALVGVSTLCTFLQQLLTILRPKPMLQC